MGQLLSWQEEQLGIRSDTQPPLLSPLSLEDPSPPKTPKNHISNVSFDLESSRGKVFSPAPSYVLSAEPCHDQNYLVSRWRLYLPVYMCPNECELSQRVIVNPRVQTPTPPNYRKIISSNNQLCYLLS